MENLQPNQFEDILPSQEKALSDLDSILNDLNLYIIYEISNTVP
jgi:hypothetical protein